MVENLSTSWGCWTLGDLLSAGARVAELVGRSAPVESIEVCTPGAGSRPGVSLILGDVSALLEARRAITEGEYLAVFGDTAPGHWSATVAGVQLHATVDGDVL